MKIPTFFLLRWLPAILLAFAARPALCQTASIISPDEKAAFAFAADVWVGQTDPATILLFFASPDQVIDESTLDAADLTVVGPDGATRSVEYVRLSSWADFLGVEGDLSLLSWEGTLAIYHLPAADPTTGWTEQEIGYHTINIEPLQIYWQNGLPVKAGPVGAFSVSQPVEVPPEELFIPTMVGITVNDNEVVAEVTLQLPHSGFAIDWGEIEKSLWTVYPNPLFVTIKAQPLEGVFPQVITPVSHTYTISDLARGAYSFSVYVNDVFTSQTEFSVGEPEPAPLDAWLEAPRLVESGQTVLPFSILYAEPIASAGVAPRLPEAIPNYVVSVILPDGSERAARLVDVKVLPTVAPPPLYQAQYELAAPDGEVWTEKDNGFYPVYLNFQAELDQPFDPAVPGWDFRFDFRYLGNLEVFIFSGTPTVNATLTAFGGEGNAKIWVSVQFQPSFRLVSDWGTPVIGKDGTILLNAKSVEAEASPLFGGWWWYNDYVYYLEPLAPGEYTARFVLDDVELASATFSVIEDNRPMVTASVPDIEEETTGHHQITVEYVVPRGLELNSLDDFDLTVSGFNDGVVLPAKYEGGVRCAAGERCLGPNGGILAIYSIATADGSWDAADNGYYSIMLSPDAVFDQTGETLPAAYLGSFAVLIREDDPPPPPTSVPLAVAEVDNLFAETSENLEFRIIYVDQEGLEVSTIQKAVVTVERVDDQASGFQLGSKAAHQIDTLEKEALPVEVASVRALDEDATVVEARYRLAGPGGSWDKSDNGRYFIKVAEEAIVNKEGVAFPGGIVGHFLVLIQPLFDETITVDNTWSFNVKIGYVDMTNYPWVFQADHGWWWFANIAAGAAETVDGDWAWDGRAGWLYLSGDVAPWMYSAGYQSWLWHYPGSQSPRWFWSAARDEWLAIE